MRPPPIRYPLPTLLLVLILLALAPRLASWAGAARQAVARRWARLVEGPPVPHSGRPQVVAGPIRRKVLTLVEDLPAADRPGGTPSATIGRRVLADVYDAWPAEGPPTHLRIGVRTPIGWVDAGSVLPWDTRLVVVPPSATLPMAETPGGPRAPVEVPEGVPLPVVAWRDDAVELAVWDPSAPWSRVARRGWVAVDAIPPASWAALVSDVELSALIVRSLPGAAEAGDSTRLAAALGRISAPQPLSPGDRAAALAALPAPVRDLPAPSPREQSERLAALNARRLADASWSGVNLRAVPLADLR